MSLVKLSKDRFIPFLDTAKDKTFVSSTWKRIDLSTIFALTVGEQESDVDYICYENPITEISGNKPELPQEIALYEGNPMYDFMFSELEALPIGEDTQVPFLLCFGGTQKKAWRGIATITSKVLNTVEGKITFSIKMGGDIEHGTYTITDGAPSFVTGG